MSIPLVPYSDPVTLALQGASPDDFADATAAFQEMLHQNMDFFDSPECTTMEQQTSSPLQSQQQPQHHQLQVGTQAFMVTNRTERQTTGVTAMNSFRSKMAERRRVRNLAPERRAVHNATERARRESLNGKFQLLASMLPNLQNFRKPSKSQIIEKALVWIEHTAYNEERYLWELGQLELENKMLREHLASKEATASSYCALPSPPPSITTSTRLYLTPDRVDNRSDMSTMPGTAKLPTAAEHLIPPHLCCTSLDAGSGVSSCTDTI
ncbi:hypothetical protein BX666DRAFT_1979199 [Dichotomocladium elegans]|nr:hypothetical protein BX666DRAFT_1979199 [Dichotomocladium elegans]